MIASAWKCRPAALAVLAATAATPVAAAPPADWSAVPVHTVTLFYPGQAGYEWLRSPAHRRANAKVQAGEACLSCHEGEEAEMGAAIVQGGRLEPAPIAGKLGAIALRVQAAHDDAKLYLRFQWKTQMPRAGQMHDYLMFDGEKWAFVGGPRSKERVRSGAEPPLYEDRLSLMIDDGKVPLFARQGCWLTCHNGMRDMPDEATKEQVQAHPLIGAQLKESDVRKYLPSTRSDAAARWDQTRPEAEIAQLKAAGAFLDLMQWRGHRSNPVGMADDGYVLDYRLFDAGKGPFSWNVDRKTMTPKFMFDAAKVGVKALALGDIGAASKPHALVREDNAVAYDPAAGWKKGDILPGRLLSRADATGSAADNAEVRGHWQDGEWTLLWTRKLDTGHAADDKALKPGSVVDLGIAIHDDNVTTRFHHVSFPLTLGIGVKGSISSVAVK